MIKQSKSKFIILMFLLFLVSFDLIYAQNDLKKIDSLKQNLSYKINNTERINSYLGLALVYENINLTIAERYLDSSNLLLKKNKYKKGFANFIIQQISIKYKKEEFTQAEELSRRAQNYFLKQNDIKNFIEASHYESTCFLVQGKSHEAVKFTNNILSKYKKKLGNNEIGLLYFDLGRAFLYHDDLMNASNNFTSSISNYKKVNNEKALIKCYRQLQIIYVKVGNYNKALNLMLYVIEKNKKYRNNRTHSSDLLDLGRIYNSIGEYKKAIPLFVEGLKLSDLTGNTNTKISIITNLTDSYLYTKNYDAIIELNTKALSNTNLDSHHVLLIYLDLVSAYNAKNEFVSAKKYLDKIFYLNKVSKNNLMEVEDLIVFNEENSKTEFGLKNYKSAYNYLKLAQKMKLDFLTKRNELKTIEQLEAFDAKSKDIKIKNDANIKQKQNIIIKENAKYIQGLIVFLISILISVIIISLFYQRLKRKNKQIASKNLIILKQKNVSDELNSTISKSLKERELLLKEIHHRVKNNLQIIMSLLSIQAKEGNNLNDVNYFLEKSQSRILAISLVHQNLYENEDMEIIDYELYITILCENLDSILNVSTKNIVFKISANQVFFDIETAIPLGLIINELVSNSYKHAFKNIENGEIEITIKRKFKNQFQLFYSDNGIGFVLNENRTQKSLGLELISSLVKQLKGEVIKINKIQGTHYEIQFKEII